MFRLVACLLTLLVILSSTGCSTAINPTGLVMDGKYGTAYDYYQNKFGCNKDQNPSNINCSSVGSLRSLAEKASLNNLDYLNLAMVNYKLKKYDRFNEYISIIEDKIRKGEKYTYNCNDEMWSGTLKTFNLVSVLNDPSGLFANLLVWPLDFRVIPHYLKSQVYLETGEYQKSLESVSKALSLLETLDLGTRLACGDSQKIHLLKLRAGINGTIGLIAALSGSREEALKQLDIVNKVDETEVNSLAATLVNEEKGYAKSSIYMALGMYDKVLVSNEDISSYGKNLAAVFNVTSGNAATGDSVGGSRFFPQHFRVTKSLLETGKIQEAKERYDTLIAIESLKSMGDIYWVLLFDRGRIAEKEGKTDEAIQYCSKAIDIIESQRSSIKTEAAKIGFVGDKQQVYNKLVSLYMSSKQYAKAFEYIERGKARALIDMLASKNDFSGKTSQKQETVAALTELTQLEATVLETPKENETVAQLVEKKGTRSLQIREKLKQIDPEFSSLVTVDKVSVEAIQKKLGNDTVLIEYHYLDPDLYIFTVTSKEIKGVVEKAPGLADKIMTFRKALQDVKSTKHLAMSSDLYQKLISPVSADITQKNIVFVPHSALHYLPFGTLKEKESYLVDTHAITYLPSASVIEFLRQRKTADPEILVFGNPDLNNPEYDLKFAEQEAQTISGEFSKSKLLTRKMATKAAFKDNAAKYQLIHIASHGYFNSESPLTSGLYLTPSGGDDGILSVSELYNTEINADLVTLSACETGMGKVVNGDDVVGLTRGFLYAGSSNIVASLWKVDDLATSDLMQGFYKNMKTMPKRVALQNAQQLVKTKYQHPFYWAAFELTGNGI